MSEPASLLKNWLRERLSWQDWSWLEQAQASFSAGASDRNVYLTFSQATRHGGHGVLGLGQKDIFAADRARVGWNPSGLTSDQAIRASLLLALPPTDESGHLMDRLYETADLGEAIALQKALPILPNPLAHMHRAREGIRSNILSVFEALTLGNPYPADYFDDIGWNHLVIKALFMEMPLWQIHGFDKRANEALSRTMFDLAKERTAAGRTFDPALWRCVGPFADAPSLQEMRKAYLGGHEASWMAAGLALQTSPAPEARTILEQASGRLTLLEGGVATWESIDALRPPQAKVTEASR